MGDGGVDTALQIGVEGKKEFTDSGIRNVLVSIAAGTPVTRPGEGQGLLQLPPASHLIDNHAQLIELGSR